MGVHFEWVCAHQDILDLRQLRRIHLGSDAGHALVRADLDDGSAADAGVPCAAYPIRIGANFLKKLELYQADVRDFGPRRPLSSTTLEGQAAP